MKNFLLLLQGYLLGRTGSKIVGVLLLVSLIWWVGPYLGLTDETLRLGIISGVLLLVLLACGVRLLLLRRRARQFQSELSQQDGEAEDRELEIEELQRKMNEAIATLKSSELGVGNRGSAALYSLPWFMIIGPSAAGKTTLLRHSGLHFPYAKDGDIDIRGFGGTRNCDWWFSNEAVLLDTAGRYTTEPGDHREWKAFLGLLRKHRRKVPVNGVVVAMSLPELLICDSAEIEKHVKIIRDRIDELITDLGCLIPVYLVFTKCDLLNGFTDFFEDLGSHERNQIWGIWLADEASGGPADAFVQRLKDLYHRLCAMRLRKMSMQRRFQAKGQIHEFPAEFKAAGARLEEFMRLLTKENPYQETPQFCGVYFTSATQEGTPIQRLLGNLRKAFGYVEEPSSEKFATTKSYFIKKIFQDAIFPNAHGVTKNRRREITTRWLKSGWIVASLAIITGSFIVLSTSLTSNTLLTQKGVSTVAELRTLAEDKPDNLRVLAVLNELDAHYQMLLAHERRLPWHLVLGIYRGSDQIRPIEEALLEGLARAFFRPVATSLEYRLENHIRQWEASDDKGREKIRGNFYRYLKVYLMLGELERLKVEAALPLLTEIWNEELARGARDAESDSSKEPNEQRENLARFYLQHLAEEGADAVLPGWSLREDIVAQARKQLRTPPNSERLYAQIINKGRLALPDRTLAELIRGYDFGTLSSDFVIPGAFTAKGWQEFVRAEIDKAVHSASRGDWVIGFQRNSASEEEQQHTRSEETGATTKREVKVAPDSESVTNQELAERLRREIRQAYFREYAETWYGFLESITLEPFHSLDDATRKILVLARSDGPIGELMRVVSANINLYEGPVNETLTDGIAVVSEVTPGDPPVRQPVPELEDPLRDLRKFCDPADQMTVSLLVNQYLLAISAVQSEVERLGAAVDVPRESYIYAANILSGGGASSELYKCWVSTSSLLNGIEARARKVAGALLMAPIGQTWNVILDRAREELQQSWKNTVRNTYGEKISGRFPFASGGRDAALIDIADFFHPNDGVLWSFVQEQLSPFLDRGRRSWHQKTWLGLGLGVNRGLIDTLERGRLISDSLFRRGGDEPEVQFYLYPMPRRGVSEMYLECNGQSYRYRNEPQEWRKFHWPGDTENLGAKIRGVVGLGTAQGELSFEGIWGLFHLLQQSRMNAEGGTQYLSVWELDGSNGLPVTVQFKIKADRENNVFERGLFSRFSVPENIF